MSHDPTAAFLTALEREGFVPRPKGSDTWESRCPAHNGDRHNLSIGKGDDGRVLLRCHAHECQPEAITKALGMELRDLFPSSRNGTPTRPQGKPASKGKSKRPRRPHKSPEAALAALHQGKPSAVWTYHHADGIETLHVARFDGPNGKSYRPVHLTAEGWEIGDPPGTLPLYRLPDLLTADRVFLTEGEKAADLTRGLGAVATTSSHGAGSAQKTDWQPLAGKEVVILPDNDEPGERYAREVIGELTKLEPRPTVRVIHLPDLPAKGDIAEWLSNVVPDTWDETDCLAELNRLVETAPPVELGPTSNDDGPEATNDWPGLTLGDAPTVEQFPLEALPVAVARFVVAVADSIGCPEDFVALPVLVVAGAAIGRSVSLTLKPGYVTTSALYGVCVGNPSSGKSPAQDVALRPMWDIDEQLHERYLAERREYDRAMEAHENTPKSQPKPPRPIKPTMESAVVENATVEALAPLLAVNPRGLLVSRDELSAWVSSFDQYKASGRGSDRQFWLTAVFGKPLRVDRKGNHELEPIRISHPFISVIGGIQPEMLTSLRESRGRSDGFIERILFAFPNPRPKPRWSDDGISSEAKADWAEIVGRLRTRPLTNSPKDKAHHCSITFTPGAKSRWVDWYNSQADEANSPSYNTAELSVDGKLCDFAARLGLILHLLNLACDPTRSATDPVPAVPSEAVENAIKLWAYFRSHHRRARWYINGGIGNPEARAILDWIKRKHIESFDERELKRNLPRFSDDPEGMKTALAWLAERHAIRPAPSPDRPPGKRGRDPAPGWMAHPDLTSPCD